MTALGKLFRTTAFKLALAYSLVFAIAAGFVIANVGWNVRQVLDDQIAETVDADIRGLSEQYSQGGIRSVVETIERRLRQPGGDLYLVATFAGDIVAGNMAAIPAGALDSSALIEATYQRKGEARPQHAALVRVFLLPGGFRLLVGHDIEERENLRRIVAKALTSSLIWLVLIGAAGGLFVARRVLIRVDAMSESARRIMSGDLAGRLPIAGTGDELDRLAENLNAMLARMSDLVTGVQSVSDNIAHDLRTPLTRLRNSAERALTIEGGPEKVRPALEKVVEEADGMMRIFDALLTIARAEVGNGPATQILDASAITRDVFELYEAAAEDDGVILSLDVPRSIFVRGNRELIGQALSNLIDNALKYARAEPSSDPSGAAKSGAHVALSIRAIDGRAELSVADDGPGIAPVDRGRVTGRFVRLEAARSKPGSGLGLSMVAAIAHLHDGELRLEDNQPGLRAVMSLPLQVPESQSLLPPPKARIAL